MTRSMNRFTIPLFAFLLIGGSLSFVACDSSAEDDTEEAAEDSVAVTTPEENEVQPEPATVQRQPPAGTVTESKPAEADKRNDIQKAAEKVSEKARETQETTRDVKEAAKDVDKALDDVKGVFD